MNAVLRPSLACKSVLWESVDERILRQSTSCVSMPAAARCGSISRSLSAPCGRPLHVISASRFFMTEERCGGRSYFLQVGYRALILHIPSVERCGRLKQDDMSFLQRVRHMLRAVRDDQKLARTDRVVMLAPFSVAPFHVQFTLRHH